MTEIQIISPDEAPFQIPVSVYPEVDQAMQDAALPHLETARLSRVAQNIAMGIVAPPEPDDKEHDAVMQLVSEAENAVRLGTKHSRDSAVAHLLRRKNQIAEGLDKDQRAAREKVVYLGHVATEAQNQAKLSATKAGQEAAQQKYLSRRDYTTAA